MKEWLTRMMLAVLRATYATLRIIPKNRMIPHDGIIAVWHDEMLGIFRYFAFMGAYVMVSHSKDGNLAERFLRKWGFHFIRGSQHRGGKEGLQQIVELAENNVVILTVDGSKGPRHRMKPGAVIAAHRSGAPLYLWRGDGFGFRLKKSWDKMLICYPFSRIRFTYEGPFTIPSNATDDDLKEAIGHFSERLENLIPESTLRTPP